MTPNHVWIVRAGHGGYAAEDCLKHGVAAVGWEDPGDLEGLVTRQDFLSRVETTSPQLKPRRQVSQASQLFRFVRELAVGDLALTPVQESREIHLGIVAGQYEYKPGLIEGLPHIRKIDWKRTISRDALSQPAKNSSGSTLTLFSMDQHRDELLKLWEDGASTDVGPGEEIEEGPPYHEEVRAKADDLISDRIAHMDPYDFQDLVAALLRAMGYHPRVSPPGADRGVDIVAYPDPLGFESPIIRAQVKQRAGTRVGGADMRNFLATLREGERGLFVSTGGFSKDSKYEAERASRGVAVTTLDLEQFVDLLTENYKDLEPAAQALLPLEPVFIPKES